MKSFVEKLAYILLLSSVFTVCLFEMVFLRNTLGIGVGGQMLILLAIAAVWQKKQTFIQT